MRDGDDLVTVVDVAAPLAALGTTLTVPTVEGGTELEIPAGTQPARDAPRSAAPGCRRCAADATGDLRVVVNVVIPRHLSHDQRELLEQLSQSLTDHNLRTEDGVFGKLKRAFGGR